MPRRKIDYQTIISMPPLPFVQEADVRASIALNNMNTKYADCALAFVGFLYRAQVKATKESRNNIDSYNRSWLLSPARLSSRFIRDTFFCSNDRLKKRIINLLYDEGILDWEDDYSTNSNLCKSYRLKPLYSPPRDAEPLSKAIITHRPVVIALRTNEQESRELVRRRTKSILGDDCSLDLEASLLAIDTKQLVSAGFHVIRNLYKSGKLNRIAVEFATSLIAAIEDRATGLTINESCSRVTSFYNMMPQKIRQLLNADSAAGVEIDLCCSQPSFLPVLFCEEWGSTRRGGFEMQKWRYLCRRGELYEHFRVGLTYTYEQVKRQYASQFVAYKIGTYKNGKNAPLRTKIASEFPVLARIIELENQNDHATVIRKLQKHECTLILTACERLQNQFDSTIPLATIHDCVWVPRWALEATKQALRDTIYELNAPLRFKIKGG